MQTGLLLGHIPVVAKAYRPLDQWSEWHACRVEEAALAINRRYPEALACLPKTGLYVLAIVGQLPQLGQAPYIACGVHVCEDTSDIVWKGKGGNSSMGASVERASPDVLGTEWNPFPNLFAQLALKMPEAWVGSFSADEGIAPIRCRNGWWTYAEMRNARSEGCEGRTRLRPLRHFLLGFERPAAQPAIASTRADAERGNECRRRSLRRIARDGRTARKGPVTDPKHRLGEMSTGYLPREVAAVRSHFRDSTATDMPGTLLSVMDAATAVSIVTRVPSDSVAG